MCGFSDLSIYITSTKRLIVLPSLSDWTQKMSLCLRREKKYFSKAWIVPFALLPKWAIGNLLGQGCQSHDHELLGKCSFSRFPSYEEAHILISKVIASTDDIGTHRAGIKTPGHQGSLIRKGVHLKYSEAACHKWGTQVLVSWKPELLSESVRCQIWKLGQVRNRRTRVRQMWGAWNMV